jgi:hypothetical protein
MKYKSIISAITFLLISMFYVASASAGPTDINVEMPKECGTWNVPSGDRMCRLRGPASGKAGVDVAFKCWGGGHGSGAVILDTQHCSRLVFKHHSNILFRNSVMHRTWVARGQAALMSSEDRKYHSLKKKHKTLTFRVCGHDGGGAGCRSKAKAQSEMRRSS